MTLRDTVVTALVVTFVLIEGKADELPFSDDEPGTVITETRAGNFDQQLVIDHTKYDGPNETPKKVVLTSHQQTQQPDEFNIPEATDFHGTHFGDSDKEVTHDGRAHQSPNSDGGNYELEGKYAMPSEFQDEISELKIPYTNLPKDLRDIGPPPDLDYHEDDDEESDENEEEKEDDGDEDNEEEEAETDEKNEEVPNYDHYFTDDFLEPYDFKDPLQSSHANKAERDQKPLKTTAFNVVVRDRQKPQSNAIPSFHFRDPLVKHRPHTVYPRRRVVPKVSENASVHKHKGNCKHRKPNNLKFWPPQKAKYVRKPLNDPHQKRPAKSQKAGNCGPRKIIKEIHFHHYDPQLSSQLGGIVPVTDTGNEDEEREVIIHRVKMPKMKHGTYDADYLENAINRYKLEFEKQLKGRKRSSFDMPPVHHRYSTPPLSGSRFSFEPQKRVANVVVEHAPVEKITTTPDGNGARYIKHQSVKYFYKTPTERFK